MKDAVTRDSKQHGQHEEAASLGQAREGLHGRLADVDDALPHGEARGEGASGIELNNLAFPRVFGTYHYPMGAGRAWIDAHQHHVAHWKRLQFHRRRKDLLVLSLGHLDVQVLSQPESVRGGNASGTVDSSGKAILCVLPVTSQQAETERGDSHADARVAHDSAPVLAPRCALATFHYRETSAGHIVHLEVTEPEILRRSIRSPH
mmetsp:Transcript_25141/g.43406  ORF Transcript_25141/g.43406 Transcript_25141/m.43406 type:complete len:205 (+) Transcript_25141:494-1108(+)